MLTRLTSEVSLRSWRPRTASVEPLLGEEAEGPQIVPRILCNRYGPSKCKRYAFLILFFFECPHFLHCLEASYRRPKKFFVLGGLSFVSYASYFIYKCATMPVPSNPCSRNNHPHNCIETPCQEGVSSILHMLTVIVAIPVIGMLAFIVFEFLKPRREDYLFYLLTILEPLLNQNQLELAYKKIFVPEKLLATTDPIIRSYLCGVFVEKLLNTDFIQMQNLDRLIVSGTDTYKAQDLCFQKCVRKLYESDQDPESILSVVAGIYDEAMRHSLVHEYATWQMRRSRLAIYTQILSHMKLEQGAFEHLVQLILDYTGTHLGITLGFMKMRIDRSKTPEEELKLELNLEQTGRTHEVLLNSTMAVMTAKIKTRIQVLKQLNKQYLEGRIPRFPEPNVLSAIQVHEAKITASHLALN